MAAGLARTRNLTVSVNGRTDSTTSVTKSIAGTRIVSVDVAPGTSPEVSVTGIQFADATGQAVTVAYKTLGPSSSATYSLVLAVGEVDDA